MYGLRRLDRMRWLPSASVCEIITVPNWANRHIQRGGQNMSVYRVIDVVGTSTTSWEEAAADAINTARQSVRDIRVAEVVKQDIHVGDGGELIYRTKIQLSFKYESQS
jgi:dodecin